MIERCSCNLEMEKLEKIVSDYISLEDTGKKYNLVSPADERANILLQETTKRVGDRFETGLLWNENDPLAPNSFPMAMKQLEYLEKKVAPEHIPIINQQNQSLEEKRYVRKMSTEEINSAFGTVWYLPFLR